MNNIKVTGVDKKVKKMKAKINRHLCGKGCL